MPWSPGDPLLSMQIKVGKVFHHTTRRKYAQQYPTNTTTATLRRTLSKVEGTPALGGADAHQRVSEHELTQAGQLYQQIKAHYTINELLCFRALLYPVILHWKLSLSPSFFFFVPGDFGWMINSLNEIVELKQKATTRYTSEQKASTNTATLTDWIEPALRKRKKNMGNLGLYINLSPKHTHTRTDYKNKAFG